MGVKRRKKTKVARVPVELEELRIKHFPELSMTDFLRVVGAKYDKVEDIEKSLRKKLRRDIWGFT